MLLVRVQAIGRFIQHQNGRVMQQRLRQTDAALETFGECLNRLQAHTFQLRHRHGACHAFIGLGAAKTANARDEMQKPCDGHFGIGGRAFRQIAKRAFGRDGRFNHILAANARRAGAGCDETRQHFHGGGFAGAIGAKEAHHFPAIHRKGHIVNSGEGAKALGQALDFDQRGQSLSPLILPQLNFLQSGAPRFDPSGAGLQAPGAVLPGIQRRHRKVMAEKPEQKPRCLPARGGKRRIARQQRFRVAMGNLHQPRKFGGVFPRIKQPGTR